MSDDMSDLFGAQTDPSGSTASTSPLRNNLASSSFAAFGGEEDDGFGSVNPFADLQSSRVGAFEPSDDLAASSSVFDEPASLRSRTSSNATERKDGSGTGAGNGWDGQETSEARRGSEDVAENDAEEVDRVLVSPFVSNPGSSSGGEGGPYDQEQDPMAGTAIADEHGFTSEPFRNNGASLSFSTQHLEDDDAARGFADRVEDPQNQSELYSEQSNPYSGNDAASIRTVGLESDAASLRSQKTQVLIHATPAPSLAPLEDEPSGRPTFLVTVSDPTKVGSAIDPINSHTVYTIRTRTSSTQFRKQDFSVLRRFRDFLWLNERLLENNPGVIIPPPPEKAMRGRFDESFVETRRLALQTCLQQILKHPLLYTDPDLRTFLESDTFHTDIKHRQQASSASLSSSIIGGSSSASSHHDTKPSFFSSLTSPRFAEFDEFFDQRRTMLDALEAGLKSLISSLTACTKNRLALSSSAAELSASYTALATCELSDNVKTALKGLSDADRKRAEVAEAQARDEEVLLLAAADQYIRSISSVRAALQSRVKIYQAYQRSESTLKSLRTSHEKIKAKSGRTNPDLVTHSLFEITEAERRVISLKKDFEDVSRLLKTSEWAKFEAEKVADFKRAIELYAKGLVERQKEVVEGWKKYVALLEGGLGKRNSVPGEGQINQNQSITA